MKRIQKAEKLKKISEIQQSSSEITQSYIDKLNSDPEYSLEVDPTNKYNMPNEQKEFIKQYVNLKNANMAAALVGIDNDTAMAYFMSYESQQEIRRINMAMYQKQFSAKLLTLDQIGGWLSSVLMDDVPIADRVKTMDKVRIAQMLIDLNNIKATGINNPASLMSSNVELEIKSLSIQTIKTLLDTTKKKLNTSEPQQIVNDSLTPEENAYISTLPTKDLLQLIDETKKE